MVLTALLGMVACSEEDPGDDPDLPNTGDEPGETPGNTGNERLSIDYLPTEQYGSEGEPAQFNILQWTTASGGTTGTVWVPWEEGDVRILDGDMLSEEVFARNAAVEQRYSVDITAEYAAVEVAPNIPFWWTLTTPWGMMPTS